MSYPSPRALLDKYGLRAKKSWGQNFLGDEAVLDDIAGLAVVAPGERVVELGAGLGHLTARLLARGAMVIAVERDRDMARVLRGELGDRILLLEADAARLDYAALARLPVPPPIPASARAPAPTSTSAPAPTSTSAPAPTSTSSPTSTPTRAEIQLAVAGNLPYHLTSPILFGLLDQADHISRAVFLLQREVAERLAASPGTRNWGLLSVLLQQRAEVSLARIVPAGAFHPPPKVESAVVRMTFGPARAEVADAARFRRLVKRGFAQRRKTLANALAAGRVAGREPLSRALAAACIDPRRRAETLTVAEWAALDQALAAAR
jgi:16S rRNA (adenine1518-N6/adenine1519-N6)-dimethyltransferase